MFIFACSTIPDQSLVSLRLENVRPCSEIEPEHEFADTAAEAKVEHAGDEVFVSAWPCHRCGTWLVTLLLDDCGIDQHTWQVVL